MADLFAMILLESPKFQFFGLIKMPIFDKIKRNKK